MLVKKIDPSWSPSENRSLKVGETIEVTDAKQLIIDGKVSSFDPETGDEMGAFEMFGKMTQKDIQDLRDMRAKEREEKKEELLKAKLEDEKKLNDELKAQVEAKKASEKKVETKKSKKK